MVRAEAVAVFVSQLDAATRDKIDLAELRKNWDAAVRAWPAFAIAPERFGAFFGERVARAGTLERLQVSDLYLTCACLDKNEAALRAFDALLVEVGRKLRSVARTDQRLDDAKQIVRQVLMVGPRSTQAALSEYGGRGELGGWLRIALGRELVRLHKRDAREPAAAPHQLDAMVDTDDDPETAYLKTHYQSEFKESFAAAMERLSPDERRVLRYSVVERLSIDDVAKLDGVHRTTAARQVARARARLTEETRRVLGERLKIDSVELASVLRLIESQVDVSVRRLLDK